MKLICPLPRLVFTAALGLLFILPAQATTQSWKTLTPLQQEALAPIAPEWNKLPQKQRKRLLATAKSYQKLSPDQKQRFQTRLAEWVKLSQEQRNKARETHKAFSKLPPDIKEDVKQQVKKTESKELLNQPDSEVKTKSEE